MTATERAPRADSVRNAERIVEAARITYASTPDPSLDDIASRAGVGVRTLYRHFPTKEDLLRACLRAGLEAELLPAIADARRAPDPFTGFGDILRAMVTLAARERNIVRAAQDARAVTAELADAALGALGTLAVSAQRAGTMRQDVDAADIHRVVGLVTTVVSDGASSTSAALRLLAIVLDGLSADGSTPLPRTVDRPTGC